MLIQRLRARVGAETVAMADSPPPAAASTPVNWWPLALAAAAVTAGFPTSSQKKAGVEYDGVRALLVAGAGFIGLRAANKV